MQGGQCSRCIRLRLLSVGRLGATCDAFPDGVPEAIVTGQADHARPIRGDNGLRFVPIVPKRRTLSPTQRSG